MKSHEVIWNEMIHWNLTRWWLENWRFWALRFKVLNPIAKKRKTLIFRNQELRIVLEILAYVLWVHILRIWHFPVECSHQPGKLWWKLRPLRLPGPLFEISEVLALLYAIAVCCLTDRMIRCRFRCVAVDGSEIPRPTPYIMGYITFPNLPQLVFSGISEFYQQIGSLLGRIRLAIAVNKVASVFVVDTPRILLLPIIQVQMVVKMEKSQKNRRNPENTTWQRWDWERNIAQHILAEICFFSFLFFFK